MKGILMVYVNYHPDDMEDKTESIKYIHELNRDVIDAIVKEADYRVMFIPTTKEACRVEKIDFPTEERTE